MDYVNCDDITGIEIMDCHYLSLVINEPISTSQQVNSKLNFKIWLEICPPGVSCTPSITQPQVDGGLVSGLKKVPKYEPIPTAPGDPLQSLPNGQIVLYGSFLMRTVV